MVISRPARAPKGQYKRLRARRLCRRLSLELLEDRILPAQVFWNVDADGFWDVAGNWQDDQGVSRLPGAGDDVVIDRPAGEFTITHRTGASSAASVTSAERLVISSGSTLTSGPLEATAGSLVCGTLAGAIVSPNTTILSEGGTLRGVTVNGTIDLASPGGSGARALFVMNGLTLNGTMLVGSDDGSRFGTVNFRGTQTFAGTGTVTLGASANAVNFLGCDPNVANNTLTLGPELTIVGGGGTLGERNSNLVNYATVAATGTVPSTGQANSLRLYNVDNYNAIRAENGAGLTLDSGVNRTWTNRSVASASGGSLTLDGLFTNLGRIEATDSAVFLLGTFTLGDLGSFQRSGGTVELGLGGTLNNQDTTLMLDEFTGPWRLNAGTIRGGIIAPAGPEYLTFGTVGTSTFDGVTVEGTIDLSRSRTTLSVTNGLTLNGTLVVGSPTASSSTVRFTGNQTVTGTGRVVLGGTNPFFGPSTFSTLTVGPNVTIDGGGLFGNHSTTRIILEGTLTTATGTSSFVPVSVNDMGALASSPEATVQINYDLLGTTRNVDAFALRGRTLVVNAAPGFLHHLEVMSRDLGITSDGYRDNFAYGTLELATFVTLQLVNDADNAAGTEPEALYAEAVIVPANATLDLNGLAVYAHAARIDGTVINGTIVLIPDSGPIALGTATAGQIAGAGETDEWSFFGRRDQAVTVLVNPGTTGSPAPPAPTLQWAEVRLLDAGGNVLASTASTQAGQVVTLSDILLPADGSYRIQVRAAPAQATSTGNYLVTYWNSTADVYRLALNEPAAGRIESPYSVDRWQFSATAGLAVQLDVLSPAPSQVWFRLTAPNGTNVFNDLAADSAVITLPLDGEYVLTAYAGQGQTGDYSFQLLATTPIELTLNTPYDGTLAGSGQFQLFRVQVPEATPLAISLDDSAADNRNELYVSLGTAPTRSSAGYQSVAPASDQRILVPMAAPGTWYVLVYSEAVATLSSFQLTAAASEVLVAEITPNHVGDAAETVLTVTGAGFVAGTTVELVAVGGAAFTGSVDFHTPERLTARFGPGTVPPDVYALRVTRPDGASAQVDEAVTMIAGGEPQLETDLILPSALPVHKSAEILYVEYANRGDVAMPAPVLVLHATTPTGNRAYMTLDRSLVVGGFESEVQPDGFSDAVQILASGATPGLLQPGESVRVPVYWAGMSFPLPASGPPQVDFLLTVSTADQTDPIDWDVLGPALRPPRLDDAAWAPILANLQAQVGSTWGDYVRMLGDIAASVGARGAPSSGALVSSVSSSSGSAAAASSFPVPSLAFSAGPSASSGSALGSPYNVDTLFAFALDQANGPHPVRTLAGAVDVALESPGIWLTFGRTYSNSILGHQERGLFGRGWHTPWEEHLVIQPDGTVYVAGAAGTQRRFQPNRQGAFGPEGYSAAPGDRGTLTRAERAGFFEYDLREADGLLRRFNYEGQLMFVEDLNGNRITAEHNSLGGVRRLTHSSGQFLDIVSGFRSRIESITDSEGNTIRYTYDTANELLTSVELPDGRVVRYTYDASTNEARQYALTSIEGPSGVTRFFEYDDAGRLTSTYLTGNAERVDYLFDSPGAVTVRDAPGDTQFLMDERGEITGLKDALGRVTFFTINDEFQLTRVIGPAGLSSAMAYDARGNLIRITDSQGQVTQFVYGQFGPGGAADRLTDIVDARGNRTHFSYDARGNLIATTDAANRIERVTYDALGNATSFTNRRGRAISVEYNAAGQVTRRSFGSQQTFTYDARGNLRTATDPDGTITLDYDEGDRLARVSYPGGRFLAYTRDAAGRRTQMVDQDGFSVNYAHDAAGRLEELTDGTGALIVRYSYDGAGRLVREDKGNGTFTTYEYDEAGQLLHLVNHAPDSGVNSRFDYTYDLSGRRTSMATIDGTWTYEYDALGQLTHAVFDSNNPAIADQDLGYVYDAVGNRIRTTINGVTTDYITNNLNQYVEVGDAEYAYDADGNLTSLTNSSGTFTFSYDDTNRLIDVDGASDSWSYGYDPLGNRDAVTQSAARTDYLLDPTGLGNVVGQYGAGGDVRYVYGLGLVGMYGSGGPRGYDFDGLGNVVGMTAPDGSVHNHYVYGPFGERLVAEEPVANPFQFAGRFGVMQESNGLDFMRARFYSPGEGRFLTNDPLGNAGGVNLLQYAANNPLTYNDPLGLTWLQWAQALAESSTSKSPWLAEEMAAYEAGAAAEAAGLSAIEAEAAAAAAASDAVAAAEAAKAAAAVAAEAETFIGVAPVAEGAAGFVSLELLIPLGVGLAVGTALVYFVPAVGDVPAKFACDVFNCDGSGGGGGLAPTPPPCRGKQCDGSNDKRDSATSEDPNAKTAPAGFGPANFVRGDGLMPYRIDFENDATATAPAQRVDVFDQLDPNLDWDTLEFTQVGFGDTTLFIPPGSRHFRTEVSMHYNNRDLQVEIALDFNSATGQILASFRSVDPNTLLPPDVLTGFLPPEDGTGRGQGYFSYLIRPDAGLATGTEIRNVARIRFDFGEIIDTNQIDPHDPTLGTDPAKEALVTIDAGAPTSRVQPLPEFANDTQFPVTWSGLDEGEPGGVGPGSGIASYDVFVSIDGGPFTLWLDDTTETSAVYAGELNHTYSFFSVATDSVGHQETTLAGAQASTTTPRDVLYFSLTAAARLTDSDGTTHNVSDADIVRLAVRPDGGHTFGLHFDGSDVGLKSLSEDIDAFNLLPDGSILVSTVGAYSVPRPGGGVLKGGGKDLLRFEPTALGDTTTGSWSRFFRGGSVGLRGLGSNIDAVALLGDGSLVISTAGAANVPRPGGGRINVRGEDLLRFTPTTAGDYSAGSWALFLDGSDVGLTTTGEGIDGLFLDESASGLPLLYFSTRGKFVVPGLTGAKEDVVAFQPTVLGDNTAGSFGPSLRLDGSGFGLAAANLDGMHLGIAPPAGPSPAAAGLRLSANPQAARQQTAAPDHLGMAEALAADRWATGWLGDLLHSKELLPCLRQLSEGFLT